MKIKIKKKDIVLELDQFEAERIVCEWYLNGMIGDMFQNEFGLDLEEVLFGDEIKDFECETIDF